VSRLVSEHDATGWSAALSGLPVAFGHQLPFVRAAARALGAQAVLWQHETPGGTRAACPLLLRADASGADIATPWGFAGFTCNATDATADNALAIAWSDFWRGQGVLAAYVQLSPWVDGAAAGTGWEAQGGAWSAGRDCLWWDLRPAPDALLAGMRAKQRQLLRKWLREDARPEFDQAALREAFVALYPAFARRAEVAAAYRFDVEALDALALAPGAWLAGARGPDGAVEAVTLFGLVDGLGDSVLSASTEAGRRHSRGLYWLGALALRERGATAMNLGGGVAEGDGLGAFKARLGALPRATRRLRQVFDEPAFVAACTRAGRDPNSMFFPPWRAPAG
jgi:hypothetical protein